MNHHASQPGPEVDPEPVRSKNTLQKVLLVLLLIVVAWIIWVTVVSLVRGDQTARQANSGQDLASQVQAECAKGGPIATQLGQLCQQAADLKNAPPPVGPTGERGTPGPVGPKGDKGDTGTGVPGVPGGTGPGGPGGDTGQPGTNGQDGTQGQPGVKGDPGATGPKGDTGPEGPRGPGGEPAPRITNVDLDQATCTGTITLSDGTSFPINMTGCTPPIIGGE
jgi:hypothetical protein